MWKKRRHMHAHLGSGWENSLRTLSHPIHFSCSFMCGQKMNMLLTRPHLSLSHCIKAAIYLFHEKLLSDSIFLLAGPVTIGSGVFAFPFSHPLCNVVIFVQAANVWLVSLAKAPLYDYLTPLFCYWYYPSLGLYYTSSLKSDHHS